jgi:hypothetical protein
MTSSGGSKLGRIGFVAVLASFGARAAEPQVRVTAEVILASNKGNTIDPPGLARMKDQFSQKGFAFTSYRRLSSERLKLRRQPVEIKLPNHRTATLRLDEMKAGTAAVRVEISNLASTTLTMGREGSLFQHAGDYEGGQLILVLSPDQPSQPRRIASGILRPAESADRDPAPLGLQLRAQ